MKPDRNGRTPRLVPVTDPAEIAAVLGPVTLQSPIGGRFGGLVVKYKLPVYGRKR